MTGWGNTNGPGPINKNHPPSHIVNELVSWVHGAHTFRFGGEYRHLAQVFRSATNESGTVNFSRGLPACLAPPAATRMQVCSWAQSTTAA